MELVNGTIDGSIKVDENGASFCEIEVCLEEGFENHQGKHGQEVWPNVAMHNRR